MSRSTLSFRSRCSSERSKSIAPSQPQDRLGDDLLLDLVRAAVDRDLAPVEVRWRDGSRPLGTDRGLVPALLLLLRLVRQRVGADDFQQKLGRRLLDLGALDFED